MREGAAVHGEAEAAGAGFLNGGGEMGALIRAHPWADTPLGPPEAWPQTLRVAVGMVLGSSFPACIAWGPGLVIIHNDAFRPILGSRPGALGRPLREVWSGAWDRVGPIAGRALAGESAFVEDLPVTVERDGYPEEAFLTFCLGPIRDAAGAVHGFLGTVIETTGKVLAERRQAFLLHLEERLRGLTDPQEVTLAAAEALGRHLGAARAGYGEIDAAGETVAVGRDWTDGSVPSLAGEARLLDAFGPAVIAELRAGRTLAVEDCLTDPRADGAQHAATWASIGTRSLIVVPLLGAGRLTAILYLHEPEPRRWSGTEVALAEDTARRSWAALGRARAEAQLRASEARLRALVNASSHVAYRMSPDWAEMRQLDGRGFLADTPAPSRNWLDEYIHPDDQAEVRAAIADAIARRSMFELEHRVRRADGSLGWTLSRAVPLLDDAGRITEWFGVASDVTERRRAEQALREGEERLRLIVENARDYAIFTTDPEGRIETWWTGAEAVFGWSGGEAVGQPAAITFTPEDRAAGAVEWEMGTARAEGRAPDVRWHLRKDGSRVFIEGSTAALRGPDGSVRGFLKIGQDVTARKAAEERQALLSREVDHRAKNALALVQTMLRLTRAEDVPSFTRAVEGRVAALARAQTLLAEGNWDGADLRALLRSELAPFLTGQRAELDGPPVVLPAGTAQPLAMAVHELATNAAKHGALSVPEGRVSVSWRLEGGATGMLRLRWAEAGGPPVAGPPARRGFGSRVLDGTVRGQLGGAVTLSWEAAGLVCGIEVPLGRGPSGAEAPDVEPPAAD
jgi:PAS domain S-box-containing protein